MFKIIIKIIAVLLNLILLAFFIYFSIKEPMLFEDSRDILFFFFIFSVPIVNLIAIFKNNSKNNWFSLFLKRKILEEKQKINKLK